MRLADLGWVAAIGAGGLLVAAFASEEGCGSTDGSFSIGDPQADPSEFCKATDFPGLPDSTESALLVGAIYLGPALIALCALGVSRVTGRASLGRWGYGLAAFLLVAVAVFSLGAAHVGYEGRV